MTEAEVVALVTDIFGVAPLAAIHQPFGHCSVTYDVALPGRQVIVRCNANSQVFATTEHNLAALAELGLPVPTVIAADRSCSHYPFAYLILDKIPGRDLRYELGEMTPAQMTNLAEQIVNFQRRVMALPPGAAYGYVGIGEKGRFRDWEALVRNECRLDDFPHADATLAGWQARLAERMQHFAPSLHAVQPTCLLDDITVKNVIVQNGELQGLIDFDCVCYGDPLFWLVLTTTGVVSDVGTRGLFYVEELKRLWGLTPEQEPLLALYAAAFALHFLRHFSVAETPEWKTRMRTAVEHWLALTELDVLPAT